MKDINVVLAFALTAALAALAILTGYLYMEDNAQAKPSPPVRITTSSTTATVKKFFVDNTRTRVNSNQTIWNYKGTELEQDQAYSLAKAKTVEQKASFKKAFLKDGGTIYKYVCYNLHSNDESWSLGYCTQTNITR